MLCVGIRSGHLLPQLDLVLADVVEQLGVGHDLARKEVAHASLNEKQTQKLDRNRQSLLLTAQSGRARKTSSQPNLEVTLKEIEKTFRGGPFTAEDRGLVQQDIDRLRTIERNRRARRYTRKRIGMRSGIDLVASL